MDVFKLFGTIAINNSDAIKGIEETGHKATALANTMGKAFGKIGDLAVSCGKTVAKGLAVSAVAMGTLIKGSVKQYAEYEQLVGGVDTLFKESSKTVQKYANNAFKTAGMSANDYMSTVTSFSASLLQSLKGDTAKAAEVADMAITDMADNANKMGTSMASIQDAYQGFAKQNYTMLDNLKLGYGGTKTEMQRLLKDAQKLTGKKYNLNNLNDVYEAIHAIQTEMGITGTTALEASETISGSWATLRSAWDNLLVGVAGGTDDLDGLISNFVLSVGTAVSNVTKILPSISSGIAQVISQISPQLPAMIQAILPGLIEGATSLFVGLASALPDLMSILATQMPFILEQVGLAFGTIAQKLPEFISSIGSVMSQLLSKESIAAGSEILANILNGITGSNIKGEDIANAINKIIDLTGTTISNTLSFITDALKWMSENQGIVKAACLTIAAGFVALKAVTNPVGLAFELIAAGIALVIANWDSVKAAWQTMCENIGSWWHENITVPIDNALKAIDEFFTETIPQAWNDMVASIGTWWTDNVDKPIGDAIASIGNFFTQTIPQTWKNMVEDVQTWWNDHAVAAINGAATSVLNFFGITVPENWSLTQSIKDAWDSVIGWINNAIAKIKEFLGLQDSAEGGSGHTPTYIPGSGTANKGLGRGSGAGNKLMGEKLTMNAAGAVFSAPTIFDTRLGYQMVGEAGPEAVAPISVLRSYIREEVEAATRKDDGMKEEFREFANALPEMLVNAFASMKFDVNNREFARLVKAVN